MGVGRRIDDDRAHALFASGMNTLDQRPFMIALKSIEFDAGRFGQASQPDIDVSQRDSTVMFRFPGAKQIQIWPVNHKDSGFLDRLGS